MQSSALQRSSNPSRYHPVRLQNPYPAHPRTLETLLVQAVNPMSVLKQAGRSPDLETDARYITISCEKLHDKEAGI